MTNGEKFQEMFPDLCIDYEDEDLVNVSSPEFFDDLEIDISWWNSEWKEPNK